MKNLRIANKMAVAFTVTIAFTLLVAGFGIMNMKTLQSQYSRLYVWQMEPIIRVFRALDCIQNTRILTRDLVLNVGNSEKQKALKADLDDNLAKMEEHIAAYDGSITNAEVRKAFDDLKGQYVERFKPGVSGIGEAALAGKDKDELADRMAQIAVSLDAIVTKLNQCIDLQVGDAKTSVDGTDELVKARVFLIAAALFVSVAVAVALGIRLSNLICQPLNTLSAFMKNAGSTGNIKLRPEDVKNIQECAKVRDEIGECIGACARFVARLNDISEALESVAKNDLTQELTLLSEEDVMGHSLQKMIGNLNAMFEEINATTNQVTIGSKQIAEGAQMLAQGSTEQATVVEQVSSSISEVSEKTSKNAGIAREAADLTNSIKENAEKGSKQMGNMMAAVKEITDASSEIKKVIKVIDDIAFQTNILALNAAVEAARAGDAGKGFAVVADEVRNLASKSAEAAKETGGLIENSVTRANLGLDIATATSASLQEIVDGVNRSNEIANQIARMSDEQAGAISQINARIDKVSQVVQQNSSTAEESAAASEEMNEQANALERKVSQFILKNG